MAEAEQPVQQFVVQRIYLKDASFESPLGARVFTRQWQPKMQVDINSSGAKLADDVYEVVLKTTVTGKLDEDTALLIEVQQAGVFTVKGVPEGDLLAKILGITCPNLLFPYLREAVDAFAVKGGFPPIGLQPVNFEALFMQAMQQRKQVN